jgi:hypothetical protein
MCGDTAVPTDTLLGSDGRGVAGVAIQMLCIMDAPTFIWDNGLSGPQNGDRLRRV